MSDIDQAKQLQVHRKSDHPTMQTDAIWGEVLACRAERNIQVRKAARIKRFLDALILDLWVASIYEENPWRSVSRDKGAYQKETRYRKLFFKYDLFIPLLDDLIGLGYVEQKIGFYNTTTGQGVRTRIKATDKLLDLCTDWDITHVFRAADVPEEETIWLKSAEDGDGNTKLLDYEDTPLIVQMRKNLGVINRKLDQSIITVPGVKADTSAKRLHRVFNDGSWEKGGRFYGGFWQQLSQRELREREKILIDGQPCCELDFKATHASMLYSIAAETPPEDSYDIPGFSRSDVKAAFMILINCESREDTLNAMRHGKHIKNSTKLLDAIEAAHPAIKDAFYKRANGLQLQQMDSLIASGVMVDMFRRGIVCLPIHDSFIVQQQYEDNLRSSMVEQWKGFFYQEPIIDKKY